MTASPSISKSGLRNSAPSLRARLEQEGPAAAAFGRFLALRRDLLPPGVCAELSKISDIGEPGPERSVRELFESEIGYPPEMLFSRFEPHPFESRIFWQGRHAWLAGECVVVRLIHPEIAFGGAGVVEGFRPSESLALAFEACDVDPSTLERAVCGFRSILPRMIDLSDRDGMLGRLSPGSESPLKLNSSRISVVRRTAAIALSVAAQWSPEKARLLVGTWLHHALQGPGFALDPSPDNLEISSDGRIGFPVGPYFSLTESARAHLLEYLLALAGRDADAACLALSHELIPAPGDPDNELLRRAFRQVVPFRDGGFDPERAFALRPASLIDEITIQWKIAGAMGRMDDAKLLPFYLGLATVLRSAETLAPGRDWLEESLRDIRILDAFGRMTGFLRPPEMAVVLGNYAAAMMSLPQHLDAALSPARQTGARPGADGGTGSNAALPPGGASIAATFLLALAGILLLAVRFAPGAQGGAAAPFGFIAILAAGLLFVVAGSRLR